MTDLIDCTLIWPRLGRRRKKPLVHKDTTNFSVLRFSLQDHFAKRVAEHDRIHNESLLRGRSLYFSIHGY